jgi:hypothetical protein
MEIEKIVEVIEGDIVVRESIITWLNENGYLDDFKLYNTDHDDLY